MLNTLLASLQCTLGGFSIFITNYVFILLLSMIYLDKGEINTFALTLTENSTISAPTWLFVFENEFNTASQPIYWVGVDTSPYVNRYNLFTLEEGVDLTLIIGQYTYSVYESPVPIVVDQNTSASGLNLVEEGRMVVSGTATQSIYD